MNINHHLDKDQYHMTEFLTVRPHNQPRREQEQACYISWFEYLPHVHIWENSLTNLRTHPNHRQLRQRFYCQQSGKNYI